jgi:hypothetical protein
MDKDQVSAAPADREAWMKEAERLAHEMQRKYHNAMVWSSRENAEDPPPAKAAWQEYQAARVLLLLHISTAAPAVQQDGWMPIESAPKKGLVDIWSDGRRFTECWRDPVCSEYRCLGNSNVLITLPLASCTHWRQPPPPPSESTGSAPAEPAPAPAMVMLTEEEIEGIAARMEASDPGSTFWREFARAVLSAASAPKEPTEPVPAQPSDASAVQAAEQFPLPPAKVQAYADTNGLPPADVKTCESCPTCGAPVTVFQPKVGEPIYTHKPADGVASAAEVAAVDSFVRSAPRREPQDTSNDPPFAGVVAIHQLVTPCKHCNAKQGEAHSVTCPYDVDSSRGGEQ